MQSRETVLRLCEMMLEHSRKAWDPEIGLYWTRKTHQNIQLATDPRGIHEIAQDSMSRSLAVLALGKHLDEAFAAIHRTLTSQVTDQQKGTYGNYPWYLESGGVKDTNAAFFITIILLIELKQFGHLLPTDLKQQILAALRHSLPHFSAPAINLAYTNAMLGKMACGLVIAEELGQQQELEAVRKNWEDCYRWTLKEGVPERLSPCYYGVDLMALGLVLSHGKDRFIRNIARAILESILQELAFYAGRVPLPALRTYNVTGEGRDRHWAAWTLGLNCASPEDLFERGVEASFCFYSLATWLVLDKAGAGDYADRPLPAPRSARGRYRGDEAASAFYHRDFQIGAFTRYNDFSERCYDNMPAGFSEDGLNLALLGAAAQMADGAWVKRPAVNETEDFIQHVNVHRPPTVTELAHHHENAMIWLLDVDDLNTEVCSIGALLRIPQFIGELYDSRGRRLDTGSGRLEEGWIFIKGQRMYAGIYPLTRWHGEDYFLSPQFKHPCFGPTDWSLQPHPESPIQPVASPYPSVRDPVVIPRSAKQRAPVKKQALSLYFPNFQFDAPRKLVCDNLSNGVFVMLVSAEAMDWPTFLARAQGVRCADTWEIDHWHPRTAWYEGIRTVRVASPAGELCFRYDYKYNQVLERSVSGAPLHAPGSMNEIRFPLNNFMLP